MSSMATEGKGALISVIGDEDTVTGFLLAGVGEVDVRRRTNYLVVRDKTTTKQIEEAFKEKKRAAAQEADMAMVVSTVAAVVTLAVALAVALAARSVVVLSGLAVRSARL